MLMVIIKSTSSWYCATLDTSIVLYIPTPCFGHLLSHLRFPFVDSLTSLHKSKLQSGEEVKNSMEPKEKPEDERGYVLSRNRRY